jgi:hypothetical protein
VLDVHLSIDTSASIGGEINALQRDLQREIAPQLRTRVPGVSFGVSRFEDFPEEPFGAAQTEENPPDTPYRLLTPITADAARVESAVASLDQPLGYGGDLPESGAEALWQIATGEGYYTRGRRLIDAYDRRPARGGGTEGGVGFRAGALRVVLHVTDAPSHRPRDYGNRFAGTHSLDQAAEALRAIGARLVGIVSGACDVDTDARCDDGPHLAARSELQQVAVFTRALGRTPVDGACPYGIDDAPIPSLEGECPLVFDASASGEGLSQTLIDAIVELVDGVRFEQVTGSASDDALGFVQRVVPVEAEQSGDGAQAQIGDLLPEDEPDGEPDSFVAVGARTRLRFEVELRNTRLAPLDVDQRFRIVVQVVGDGLILEQRTLRIRIPAADALVPPRPPDEDAGAL